jgi:hypothetical protein
VSLDGFLPLLKPQFPATVHSTKAPGFVRYSAAQTRAFTTSEASGLRPYGVAAAAGDALVFPVTYYRVLFARSEA